jgi:uncharacterized protein (DUF488 family)
MDDRCQRMKCIYTIGHSTHPPDRFLSLLTQHGITALCDVRSNPYSRYNPQFNRENLQALLDAGGISYVYLGRELGARSSDPSCYEEGRIVYHRLARTALFEAGIQRLREGLDDGFRIALMCAEKEPLECHRTILVSRHLAALGVPIQHIHAGGEIETHTDAVRRMAQLTGVPDYDLFRSAEDLEAEAYRRQEARIAYASDAAWKQASKTAAG